MSDYLKRIREVGNLDRYLLPRHNDYIDVSSYPSYVDYNSFSGGEGAVPLHYPNYDDGLPSERHDFREFQKTTDFPSIFTEKTTHIHDVEEEEDVEQKEEEEAITFKYAASKELNYTITQSSDNIHLIDVDYENDMYFLHNQVIMRINLDESGAEFEIVASIDDTHDVIKEAHVSLINFRLNFVI